MLAAKDMQLLDKWLMIYLQTHPQYEGQPISQDVFDKWKKDLISAILVSIEITKNGTIT